MVPVQIRDKQVWVGDTPYALLSGEVHYWRLQPENWRAVLRQVRALGLEMAATYVCWQYHEIAPGEYDFAGRTAPARNLLGFLEAVVAEGLKLILRPGPYIYSEWVNAGIPDRVVGLHRLHPDFKAAALPFMAAVVDTARPFLATNGGPILLWQAENEPDPWPYYYEEQLGLGEAPGLFHEFLEKRYENVSALNSAWEIDLSDFAQAQVVMRPAFRDRAYLNRYLDFCRFRAWYAAECVRWTAGEFRRLGVDVPILANTYVTPQIGGWRDFEADGAADVAGPDLYPSNEFRADPDEHRRFLDTLRRTRTYSALPVIPEFEAGIWQGGQNETGVLSANHYLLACLSALMAGVTGWNWYMLVNRDNWLWSPINEWGRTRPELYDSFAQIVRIFREIDPPNLEKITFVGAVVNVRDPLPLPECDAVLRALYDADMDFESDDLEINPVKVEQPLLLYAGGDWLSREAQAMLLTRIEAGRTLVFLQTLPMLDETLSPYNGLGLQRPERVVEAGYPQRLRLDFGDASAILSAKALFSYKSLPDGATPLFAERVQDAPHGVGEMRLHEDFPMGRRYTVGYQQQRGKGQIIVLGVPPTPEVLRAIYGALLAQPLPGARGSHVKTACFAQDKRRVLIAVNNGDESHEVTIDVGRNLNPGVWSARDLITGEETLLTDSAHVLLHVPAKSGTVVVLESKNG